MIKRVFYLLLLVLTMTLSFCTTTKKAASGDADHKVMYTYEADIAPLMVQHCTPCHFPGRGKMKFLDTHKAVKDNIDNIIYKVELPVGTDGFMPFKSAVALSEDQIKTLKGWRDSGMN
jgi:hypothetical protein